MSFKKKLLSGDVVETWPYETGIYRGISVGVFDRMIGRPKAVVHVESIDSADGIVNRIVINKRKAEKYGFSIVIDEQ